MIRKFYFLGLLVVFAVLLTVSSCKKDTPSNPNIPDVNINVTIDPNSSLFIQLNTVGGWLYLDEVPGMYIPYPSRGIIVYRQDVNLFKAYERQPPNDPFRCDKGNSLTKLVVGDNYPFVKDTCTGTLYSILDGTIFSGEGVYPLIEYNAFYDGGLLYINN
ncbi:MAG: hypothetical protein GXO86_00975 [Chlorobi bacterium]|nr:hypothetical protein [Chlorobiota bacterium]